MCVVTLGVRPVKGPLGMSGAVFIEQIKVLGAVWVVGGPFAVRVLREVGEFVSSGVAPDKSVILIVIVDDLVIEESQCWGAVWVSQVLEHTIHGELIYSPI
jgi:hypothetical protein